MSSSESRPVPLSEQAEPSWRGFLAVFLGVALACLAATAMAMVIVDPLGVVQSGSWCGAGAKADPARYFKPVTAMIARPRTILLGTSRIQLGFDHEALAQLGRAPRANLGVENGQPEDFAVLAADALASGRLERALIGVDLNSLHAEAAPDHIKAISNSAWPQANLLWRGYASEEAVSGLLIALPHCKPLYRADGSSIGTAGRLAPQTLNRAKALARLEVEMVARREVLSRDGGRRVATRKAELRGLLARLRLQGVRTTVFFAPMSEELLSVLGKSGIAEEIPGWRREITALAHSEGAEFIDLGTPQAVAALKLPPCPGGGIGCHFADAVHFSPVVGRALAQRLAQSR